MATVVGTQTSESEKNRIVVLIGTATMEFGDDILLITIPPEHQAPTGREIEVRWEVTLREVEDVP